MPYENELAGYDSVKRLAASKRVHELLGKHKIVKAPPFDDSVASASVTDCTIVTPNILARREDWVPDYLLSIDGSYMEVTVDNGFPGAMASYITAAAVLIKLKEMQELDKQRPVDPRRFRETHSTDPVDAVLPGCNVTYEGEFDPRASLRRGVIDLFASQKAFNDGETMLDTYHVLLQHRTDTQSQNCPYGRDCGTNEGREMYRRGTGSYECACLLKRTFHSTDALRFHERFNPIGENGAVYSEIMQVLERLWLVHVLRGIEARGHLNALSRLAVVVDGPLAVFGQPAWLSQSIYRELMRLNQKLHAATGTEMLVVGVEKSGFFYDHFKRLCEAAERGAISLTISPQTAILLTNDYIRKKIIFSEGTHPYGDATYFGRKFFYKTKSGAQLVATIPFLAEEHRDLNTARIDQHPRLADALNLFDAVVSSRYPDALMPIALAHSQAAIPLRHGTRVLEKLARELIKPGAAT
jgi:NurA domain.